MERQQEKSYSPIKKIKKPHFIKKEKQVINCDASDSPALSDEEEKELERLVFGGEDEVLGNLTEIKRPKLSKKPKSKKAIEDDDENISVEDVSEKRSAKRKAAWEDEDDDNILVKEKADTLNKCPKAILLKSKEKYSEHLKTKYLEIRKTPKWANLDREDEVSSGDSDEDDDILKSTGFLLGRSETLLPTNIKIHKCRNLNYEQRSNSILKCVEFHPNAQVAVVAGFDGTATIFQVDGKANAKIQSVHFDRFPIHTAHFTVAGDQIVVGSKEYGHFYYYDMMAGKVVKVPWDRGTSYTNMRRFVMSPDGKFIAALGRFGNIHLLSAKSKEIIKTMKMNGEINSIAFTSDGTKMFSTGNTGEVYVWDMQSRQCTHKFIDEGCIAGSSLAVSPNNKYLAVGSDMGIVNLYETSTALSCSSPEPVKVLKNLTTEVSALKFNSTSEILLMSSFSKDNAMRLVHVQSRTAFTNFPIPRQNFYHIHCFDTSLNSGYLSAGNNAGTAYLFRLKHYENY